MSPLDTRFMAVSHCNEGALSWSRLSTSLVVVCCGGHVFAVNLTSSRGHNASSQWVCCHGDKCVVMAIYHHNNKPAVIPLSSLLPPSRLSWDTHRYQHQLLDITTEYHQFEGKWLIFLLKDLQMCWREPWCFLCVCFSWNGDQRDVRWVYLWMFSLDMT